MNKIESWGNLNGWTSRGITCQVRGMEYKGITPSYYRVNLVGKNLFSESFYEGNDLQDCITSLKEIGFDIKYSEKFVLKDFLIKYLKPTDRCVDADDMCFRIEYENGYFSVFLEVNEDIYVKYLGAKYFNVKNITIDDFNDTLAKNILNENEFTKAMEELGWI